MENFLELGLPKALVESLTNMGITKPTPIQAKALPVALEGKDILGSAATGTGKTAAFAIPIINKIVRDSSATALILSPTRELATQICEAIKLMSAKSCEAKTALLIGGDSMHKQLNQLRTRPRIIVGTPGRVTDHLKRRSLDLSKVKILVLDETDRMLDMGFAPQIEVIAKYVPVERQTLLFSATMPHNIVKLSQRYLTNPVKIEAGEMNKPADNIKHEIVNVDGNTKFVKLCEQLDRREGSVVIFVKTKHGADKLSRKLNKENFASEAIHGDLRQRQRERVIQDFRDSKYRILVATDVASRGLDIPHIKHVINHDLPQKPEDFIHRIGRTARNGAEGEAVSLIMAEDSRMWRDINRLLNPGAPELEVKRDYANNNNRGRNRNNSRSRNSGGGYKGNNPRSEGRDANIGGGYKGNNPRSNDNRPRSNEDRPRRFKKYSNDSKVA
jgi:ATP-dependent RNA helicase DeaD